MFGNMQLVANPIRILRENQLYLMSGGSFASSAATVNTVTIHGLSDSADIKAAINTFSDRAEQNHWPSRYLDLDFADNIVLAAQQHTAKFDKLLTTSRVRASLEGQVGNLATSLVATSFSHEGDYTTATRGYAAGGFKQYDDMSNSAEGGCWGPMAHSFGSIGALRLLCVVKQLADRNGKDSDWANLLNNWGYIVCFAPPFSGSVLANLGSILPSSSYAQRLLKRGFGCKVQVNKLYLNRLPVLSSTIPVHPPAFV